MTTRGVTLTALLIALGRPAWWLLAVAGFLVRGGILVFLLAIVNVPSPLVLSNVLGPLVVPLAFGTILPETVLILGGAIVLTLGWLVFGSWIAALTEVVLISDARWASADAALGPSGSSVTGGSRHTPGGGRLLAGRVATAHVLAHVPTAFALALGGVAVVTTTYRELTNPSDSGPITFRVIAAAIAPIATICGLWLFGEVLGGLAARRIVLDGATILGGLGRASVSLVRRPIGSLIVPLLMTAVLALDLGAVLAVVAVVLGEVRDRLRDGLADPLATSLTVVTFGGAWCLALLVTGLIGSWRSAAMTLEHVRRARGAAGAESVSETRGGSAGPAATG